MSLAFRDIVLKPTNRTNKAQDSAVVGKALEVLAGVTLRAMEVASLALATDSTLTLQVGAAAVIPAQAPTAAALQVD